MQQHNTYDTSEAEQKPESSEKPITEANSEEPKEYSLKPLLKSLKTFSREDLETIQDRTESLIRRRKKAERKNALQEAKEIIKKHNISPEELADEPS